MKAEYISLTGLSTSIESMSRDAAFASWFQHQLRRREWSQSDAARKLGVSTGVISHWYNGKRLPEPRSCDLIADVFGVSVDLVLELAGHRPALTTLAPDSPAPMIAALAERVDWTPERAATVELILQNFIKLDREKSR
jgi:transcriptional regulator with XRE-family HTH domain